ncbi:hypothetical protein U1Q18_021656 [Sarracenia purpurea var. burkii]
MGTSPLFSSKLCFSALVLLSDLYEVSRRGRIGDWNRPWDDAFTSQRPGARLRSGLSKQSRPWDGGILSLSSGVLLPGGGDNNRGRKSWGLLGSESGRSRESSIDSVR